MSLFGGTKQRPEIEPCLRRTGRVSRMLRRNALGAQTIRRAIAAIRTPNCSAWCRNDGYEIRAARLLWWVFSTIRRTSFPEGRLGQPQGARQRHEKLRHHLYDGDDQIRDHHREWDAQEDFEARCCRDPTRKRRGAR